MAVVIGIALIVMAVFLVISILLQSSKDHRLSGTIAGGAETFFGKQKGKTVDSLLNKITAVVCALFFISVIAMFIVTDNDEVVNPDEVPVEEQTEDEKTEEVKTEDEKTEEVKTEDEQAEDEKVEDEKTEEVKTEDEKTEDEKVEDEQTEDEKVEEQQPEEN